MEPSRFQWNIEKFDFQDIETRKKRKRLIASTCCQGPRSLFRVLSTLYSVVIIWSVVSANDCRPERTSTDASVREMDGDENQNQGHCEKLQKDVELEHQGQSDLNLNEDTKSGLIRKMAEGLPIWGVAVLDGELYVVRLSTEIIEVHDIPTGKMVRTIPVKGLTSPFDMVSSDRCKCLFVSDLKTKSVVRVHKNGDVTKWPMSETPFGLSINSAGNLLVTFTDINTIGEFTADGGLVRTVKVSDKIFGLWYALDADDGGFIISCVHMKRKYSVSRCSHYTVCTVDSHGESAEGSGSIATAYSDSTKECPAHINPVASVQLAAVNSSRSVILADHLGGYVYLLSKTMHFLKVQTDAMPDVSRPFRVCFDDESGLTFVAEYRGDENGPNRRLTGGHVKVFRINLSTETTKLYSSDDKKLPAENDAAAAAATDDNDDDDGEN